MAKVVGYKPGEAKEFDLAEGETLPDGWSDHPAPGDHPMEQGNKTAETEQPAIPVRDTLRDHGEPADLDPSQTRLDDFERDVVPPDDLPDDETLDEMTKPKGRK